MVPVGKDLILIGQVRTAAVDEVDARQVVLFGNLLGAQMLFDSDRIIGATLHGGVVADHHDLLPHNAANARDDARAGGGAVIHAMGGGGANLEKWRAGIEQVRHTAAGQHLATALMTGAGSLAAAHAGGRGCRVDLLQRFEMRRLIGPEGLGPGYDARCQTHLKSPVPLCLCELPQAPPV